MIEDPTTAEINLFNALTEMDKAYMNDGRCIEAGLQTFLRSHKVGGYTPQVAKILIERKLIKNNPKGTRRNPLIYYDSQTTPNLELCRDIFETIRSRNRMSEAMKEKKIIKLKDTNEKIDVKTFVDFKPDIDPKEDAINEMKADVLKQLEFHTSEQLKYKTIYEYLNKQS